LTEDVVAEVAIIGAGYTGLSAALHLAEAGASVAVVEGVDIGFGGSGRNVGLVNAGLWVMPSRLLRELGDIYGPRLLRQLGDAPALVFELIEKHGIDCQPVRNGTLHCAADAKGLAELADRCRQWQEQGAPVRLLDTKETAAKLGTPAYQGSLLDLRAGTLQPLAYTRGLVRAAQGLGVAVHGGTEVTALERRGSHWHASTATGASVTAGQVLIATNGYTGALWPGLKRTVLAANSFIVATEPLKGAAADAILPRGETASTSQRLLLYFRKDAQGRLLMGGRGHFADPAGPADFAHLERSLELLFPQLGRLRYEYRWAGRIAVTRDFMPHVHTPAPGMTIALGYNGRGIALATSMGRHVAARMLDAGADFPYPVSPIRPIPLHGLQRFYIAGGVAWYSLLDRLA